MANHDLRQRRSISLVFRLNDARSAQISDITDQGSSRATLDIDIVSNTACMHIYTQFSIRPMYTCVSEREGGYGHRYMSRDLEQFRSLVAAHIR